MDKYGIKPGTLVKLKPGQPPQPGVLKVERIVGDILVQLGLASRDKDCCVYSLNIAEGTTINTENIIINGEYTIGDITYEGGTLQDFVTNLIEYINSNTLIVYDYFPSHAEAGVGGVPIEGIYKLSADNEYGMTEGVLIARQP